MPSIVDVLRLYRISLLEIRQGGQGTVIPVTSWLSITLSVIRWLFVGLPGATNNPGFNAFYRSSKKQLDFIF